MLLILIKKKNTEKLMSLRYEKENFLFFLHKQNPTIMILNPTYFSVAWHAYQASRPSFKN